MVHFIKFFLQGLGLLGWVSAVAHAESLPSCATLEAFTGNIQILDQTRSQLLSKGLEESEATGTPIACSNWISVEQGWAKISQNNHLRLRLGPKSFLYLPKTNKDLQEPITLYKGQLYVESLSTQIHSEIVTPTTKIKLTNGKSIVIFDQTRQVTQVIALENKVTLENRFEPTLTMTVFPGQSSQLDFQHPDMAPQSPVSVSLALLKTKLLEFRFSESEEIQILKNINFLHQQQTSIDLEKPVRTPSSLKTNEPNEPFTEHLKKVPGPPSRPSVSDPILDEHLLGDRTLNSKTRQTLLHPSQQESRTSSLFLNNENSDLILSPTESKAKGELLKELKKLQKAL